MTRPGRGYLPTLLLLLGCLLPSLLVDAAHSSPSVDVKTEMEMGREFAREFKKTHQMTHDSALSERVNRIGQSLVAAMGPTMFPYEFNVVADPEVNACAFPGGFMFYNEGLLRSARTDDALAYVIGHELVHAWHRHIVRSADKTSVAAAVGALASIAVKDYQMNIASIVATYASASYSRDNEREADHCGLELAWKAGYDPSKCTELFDIFIELEKGKHVSRYLRSHPPPADRKAHAVLFCAELAKMPRPTSATLTPAPTVDVAAITGDTSAYAIAAHPLQPLQVGNEWTYTVSGLGGTSSYSVRVTAAIDTGKGQVYRAETLMGDRAVAFQVLTTSSGIWRRTKLADPSSPWRLDCALEPASQQPYIYSVVGKEAVTVPCGSFADCLHIRRTGSDSKDLVDSWFAAGVGMVRRVAASGVTETLAKYRTQADTAKVPAIGGSEATEQPSQQHP